MDFLKGMGNISGARHVIAGSLDLLSLQELMPQLHRRVRTIRFNAYRQTSKEDRRDFLAAFQNLVRRLPLPNQQNLPEELEFVLANSAGCVGTLKDWLRRALAHALRFGLPSVDGGILRATAFEPGAVHAMSGDAWPMETLSQLSAPQNEQPPQRTKGKNKQRQPGERGPAIDPVGPAHEAA